jgi:hypothetical protein
LAGIEQRNIVSSKYSHLLDCIADCIGNFPLESMLNTVITVITVGFYMKRKSEKEQKGEVKK